MKRQRRSRHRLSAVSVSAVALLTAAPLLSGCSTDSHPGAAAVVGDERITLSRVQSLVETVRDEQRAQPNADDLISRSNRLTRETVNFLVVVELIDRVATEHGVDVTRRQVQQTRDQAERSVGGAEALRQSALMPASGTPIAGEQIDMVIRRDLQVQGLVAEFGSGPEAETRLFEELAQTAEEVGVEINPRYGEWDAENVMLTEATTPWLHPEPPGFSAA
ncbi:SurA N-terminal domain-containing protein [Streptomyces sp. 4N509B]|uniref:SurA N-terminal domain-containing protein n=1 Tax=Streptomyces sp. 4N509B TaxID=3457413 RepID=UPI003FD6A175